VGRRINQIAQIREADDFTYSALRPVLFLFFFVGTKAIANKAQLQAGLVKALL
jgi:hypothetical protein